MLLEVGLMDASKGLDDDGAAAKVTGLQSGVFAAAALAVVAISDNNPAETLGLVVTGNV